MITEKMPVAFAVTFIWIGFVCAISFIEAWLKFRAPGITVPLGLGIGRLVFGALNKAEWVLASAIMLNFILAKTNLWMPANLFFLIPFVLLIIQTTWLLPALDARAEMHINEQAVSPSNLHFYYVGMEVVKVVCLVIFGTTLFKSTTI